MLARTSGSNDSSIRPCEDCHTKRTPSFKMLSATAMATTTSIHHQPVAAASTKPSSTPTEVHTSVMR